MKAIHTISGLSVYGGGPSLSTLLSVRGLREAGVDTQILTFAPNAPGDSLIASEPYITALDVKRDHRFAYSPAFARELQALATSAHVLHAQGVWQYPTHATAVVARRLHKPYLISLRGMLYPQAMQSSALVKRISMHLYQRADLAHAACIHATCREEMEHYRNLGLHNPVVVLPNPIEMRDIPAVKHADGVVRIGYLGRVHPRKRVERLMQALAAIGGDKVGCELVVIGGGDKEYEAFLRDEAQRLQLHNVRFTGFLSGQAKEDALQSLSFLFVPSDFENFGNIVTEALVRGIPVMASTGTPWQELNTHNCGWWVSNDVDTIAATMQAAIALTPDERNAMGDRGRSLIAQNYSLPVVAARMKQVYEWLLGGPKPTCVYE